MIKLIHRYKQSIGIVFLFVALCFAISGVTVDVLSGTKARGQYAVKINDEEYSLSDFRRAEERIELQYRQMFGDNYEKIAQSIRFNIPQQALDNIVDSHLLSERAKDLGFAATETESNDAIVKKIFNPAVGMPAYSRDAYRAFLQRSGQSATQFESSVREDLIRSALMGLLEDVGVPTSADARALIQQQETTLTFSAVEITGQSVEQDVTPPNDADVQKYYESNATDFELPARVAYDYVIFDPKSFKSAVNVTSQDIELAYTDDPPRFTAPAQIKVRIIKILFPKENDPKKMAAVSEKAKKVHEDAVSQKSFETLVSLHSDDLPTKMTGGLRQWLSKSSAPKEYLTQVFDTPVGGIAPLIEADYGYEIVKMEEKKESALRPLEEVRGEIEEQLRMQEAPAYASAAARQVAQKIKEGAAFDAAVAGSGQAVTSSSGLLDSSQDPDPRVRGLTRQVLVIPKAEQNQPTVLEVGDLSVLVKLKEYKEPAPAPLPEVKERIISIIKEKTGRELAEKKARELLDTLKSDSTSNLVALAKSKGLAPKERLSISRANPTDSSFSALTPELREDLFKQVTPALLPQVYSTTGGVALAQVLSVTVPDTSTLPSEKVQQYREQAKQQTTRGTLDATLALLKSKATIDFDPGILSAR
jgi:peptidyl-prolyl cis-trans isomerase D